MEIKQEITWHIIESEKDYPSEIDGIVYKDIYTGEPCIDILKYSFDELSGEEIKIVPFFINNKNSRSQSFRAWASMPIFHGKCTACNNFEECEHVYRKNGKPFRMKISALRCEQYNSLRRDCPRGQSQTVCNG